MNFILIQYYNIYKNKLDKKQKKVNESSKLLVQETISFDLYMTI